MRKVGLLFVDVFSKCLLFVPHCLELAFQFLDCQRLLHNDTIQLIEQALLMCKDNFQLNDSGRLAGCRIRVLW